MKRRDFIFRTAAAAAGAIVLPNIWSCKKDNNSDPIPHFDYLEVSGTHYDIGNQIGSVFKEKIINAQAGISDYLNMAKELVVAAPDVFYDPFLAAAENVFPDYIDEIQGVADGTGLSFQDMLISNIFMEIIYMYMELSGKSLPLSFKNLGCSTVAYAKNEKLFLAHNEDLFTSFLDGMYVLKISISGKPETIGLSYPGLLPGIPPSMNEAGIVQCGNDICGLHIEPSVPMVFHFRSVMDATSLDDAVSRVIIPQRARTMTHNIGSWDENKIVSIEAAPSKNNIHEISEFYVHTNHFIQPDMLDIEIDPSGLPSSESRFNILTAETENFIDKPDNVNSELLTTFLSSHEGDYCPCVHDHDGASTLGHAVFDFSEKNIKLFYSNPCFDNHNKYNL